jgi:hypothetical protein
LKCLPEEEDDTAVAGAVDYKEKEVFHMPRFDRTGPMGAGPMTGGGRGFCNPAYAGYGVGYGGGLGYGRGRGRGYGPGFGGRAFYPAWGAGYNPAYGPAYVNPYGMKPEDELQMLKSEADAIKSDLEGINKRIEELESKSQPS